MKAFAVKGPDGLLCSDGVGGEEDQAWDNFSPRTRLQWLAKGFTCVPVQIVEASQDAARQVDADKQKIIRWLSKSETGGPFYFTFKEQTAIVAALRAESTPRTDAAEGAVAAAKKEGE